MSEDKLSKNYHHLNENETNAFKDWQESNESELPANTNVRFYGLFLNGNNCEDIVRLNPDVTLGQVIHARISSDWDDKKAAYLNNLFLITEERHRQVTLETINMLSNLLAVNTARYNSKLRQYWKSNKEEDLGDLALSLKQMKEMAELHQKMGGVQGTKKQVVSGEVTHTHVHKTEANEPDGPMESEDAADTISKMLEGRTS